MVDMVKFTKATMMELRVPEIKMKRSRVEGYSGLYCEQGKKVYSFQYCYVSPVTGKRRFITLQKFSYGDNINKKILDGIIHQLTLKQAEVLKDIDPLAIKQQQRVVLNIEKNKQSVDDVYSQWIKSKAYQSRAASTRHNYESAYKRRLKGTLGCMDIISLDGDTIEAVIKPFEGSRYNMALLTVVGICKYAVSELKLMKVPATYGIKLREQLGSRERVLTKVELAILMGSNDGWDSLRNIAKMQLLTGCRNIEITGLLWSEIDMKEKTISISSDRIKTERAYKKQQRSHVLPLMPMMSEILLEQRQHGTEGFVFPKAMGSGVYHAASCNQWLKSHIKSDISSHVLRHSCATYLAETSGLSEYDIKLILNHTATGSTKKYIHGQKINRKREILTLWHQQLKNIVLEETAEAI